MWPNMGFRSAFWILIHAAFVGFERYFELVILRLGGGSRRFWCYELYRFWWHGRFLTKPCRLAVFLAERGAVPSEESRHGHAGSLRTDAPAYMSVMVEDRNVRRLYRTRRVRLYLFPGKLANVWHLRLNWPLLRLLTLIFLFHWLYHGKSNPLAVKIRNSPNFLDAFERLRSQPMMTVI